MRDRRERLNRNYRTVLVVIILLFIILLLNAVYAWLRLSVDSSKVNVIRAGKVEMVLDESLSENIMLESTVPMSQTEGMKTEPYLFTLKNDSNVTYGYEIYLDDLPLEITEKRMQDKFVRYNISRDNGATTTGLVSSLGENPNRLIASGTIGQEEITYRLRMWLDNEATNEVMGTIFYATLRIEVTQIT